jgi:hypothetical protein
VPAKEAESTRFTTTGDLREDKAKLCPSLVSGPPRFEGAPVYKANALESRVTEQLWDGHS